MLHVLAMQVNQHVYQSIVKIVMASYYASLLCGQDQSSMIEHQFIEKARFRQFEIQTSFCQIKVIITKY